TLAPHPPAALELHEALALRRARLQACESVLELIGGTPLVRLRNLELPGVELWAKCEFANPGGSVKDRPALQMLRDAIADGRLTHFLAGVGTSGTIMGTGRRLKEHRRPGAEGASPIHVIAIEPDDSLHGLEGLKHMESSIVPKIWRPGECVDEIMPMSTDEAW